MRARAGAERRTAGVVPGLAGIVLGLAGIVPGLAGIVLGPAGIVPVAVAVAGAVDAPPVESEPATVDAGETDAGTVAAEVPPDDAARERQPGNPESDPLLRPSPLVAQFWVAVAVIAAGFVAAVGML